MRIANVAAFNIKGKSFSLGLAPATAIIGPNFSGKTAIPDTIRVCLIGYLPELGKMPDATFELSSGGLAKSTLTFDDGSILSRTFTPTGKPVTTGTVPDFGTLLQADYYFGLTDTQRTDYIFSMVALPGEYSADGIIAEVERFSFEEHTEQIETAKRQAIQDLRACFDGRVIQEALLAAVAKFRLRFAESNRRSKETMGAVATLTELKLREKSVVAAGTDYDKEFAVFADEIRKIDEKRGQMVEMNAAADRAGRRVVELRTFIDEPPQPYAKTIEDLMAQIEPVTEEFTKEKRDQTAVAIGRARAALEGQQAKHTTAKTSLANAERQLEILNETQSCPYCHSDQKGWRVTVKKGITATIRTEKERFEDSEKEIAKLQAGLDSISKRIEEELEMAGRRTKQQVIKSSIERLQGEQEQHQKAVVAWRAELSDLEKQELSRCDAAALEKLEDERSAWVLKREALRTRQDAETRLMQDVRRAAEAELEHRKAAAEVVVIKRVAKFLLDKREALVEEAFRSLLEKANALVVGITKFPLAFHENTVGMWDGPTFIKHRVFSGAEKALAYIAMALALSYSAKLKIVLLDEFGRLRADTQTLVLARLFELLDAGTIDQFIIVGTSLPIHDSRLKVIDLE